MRVPGISDVVQRLRELADRGLAEIGNGASSNDLSSAESILGVKLPTGYRSLLENVGWARVKSLGVLGVGDDVPEDLNLSIAATEPSATGGFVPVAKDRTGAIYLVDANHVGPYESPIYRSTFTGAEPEYAGHDLPSWLMRSLADLL